MEQLSKVVHIAIYSISYNAGKSSAKRAPSPTVPWAGDTNCYLVLGLSFEGGIFNEQNTTLGRRLLGGPPTRRTKSEVAS